MCCVKRMATYSNFLLDVFSLFFFLHNVSTQKLDVSHNLITTFLSLIRIEIFS